MGWLFWIVEMLVPATMALFGALVLRAGYKRAGRVLLAGGVVLAAATVAAKLLSPLSAGTQSMLNVGVQLLVFLAVALLVGKDLKNR